MSGTKNLQDESCLLTHQNSSVFLIKQRSEVPRNNRNAFGSNLFSHISKIFLKLIFDDHSLPVLPEIHGALSLRDSNSKFHVDATWNWNFWTNSSAFATCTMFTSQLTVACQFNHWEADRKVDRTVVIQTTSTNPSSRLFKSSPSDLYAISARECTSAGDGQQG